MTMSLVSCSTWCKKEVVSALQTGQDHRVRNNRYQDLNTAVSLLGLFDGKLTENRQQNNPGVVALGHTPAVAG